MWFGFGWTIFQLITEIFISSFTKFFVILWFWKYWTWLHRISLFLFEFLTAERDMMFKLIRTQRKETTVWMYFICKNRNGESGNGMLGMQRIRVGMWGIRVEMRESRWECGESGSEWLESGWEWCGSGWECDE